LGELPFWVFRDASEILVTESNELARMLDNKAFAAMNYRVEIAVRSEMSRLRKISDALRKLIPTTKEDE
jgi:hypothetical protein